MDQVAAKGDVLRYYFSCLYNNNVLSQNSFDDLHTLYIREKRPLFSYSFGFNCFRYLDRIECHARLGHTEEGQI